MPARLELIRGEGHSWPRAFAADMCDELCAAADEAVTLEKALRAVLRTICGRMRWNAGRAVHHETHPVWYVDSHDTIPALRRVVRAERAIAWNEAWSLTQIGKFSTITFPIEWSSGSCLELFSTEYAPAPEEALDDVARALVPAAALLRRKEPARKQQALSERYLKPLFDLPIACYVVSRETGAILVANDAASAAVGYSREELASMTFSSLLCGADRGLPPPGTVALRRQRRNDGCELIIEVRTYPNALDDGEPALIVTALGRAVFGTPVNT